MKRFRCWDAATVQQTVFGDIGSLGLDADAVFLAAHSSVDVDHTKGVHYENAERELAVLRALQAGFAVEDANTLIAVTGPSGSGKSHLVRWVRAHLDADSDEYHLVYVPRELATLRELLGHVLDRMPGSESDVVREELDKAVGQRSAERLAEELLDRLRYVLGYELPDSREGADVETRKYLLGTRQADASSSRENGIADLLLAKPLREHFLRDGGAITRMIDSVTGQRRGGDEEVPEFSDADWPTRQPGILRSLERPLQQLFNFVGNESMAVDLLNEARNRAIAETLGMRQGVNLGEVFLTTRRRLRTEGRDLVLLFEDLAQFGLFDGELFDQLGVQPGDDLAPIRAVFAITDGKFYENVPPTVQTRLSDRFEVGAMVVEGADGATEDATSFVARYLNIARVGRSRLIEAWERADRESREGGEWVPNACLDRGDGRECEHREDCWPAFGTTGDTGLYPYNRTAITRALRKKGDRLTARTLVDELVHGFLIEADPSIEHGRFPPESAKDRFDFGVGVDRATVLDGYEGPEAERDRLHRARVIWADGHVEPSGVAVAFDLPTPEGRGMERRLTGDEGGSNAVPPAPAPTPLRSPSQGEPLRPLFAWENGEGLSETETTWYRDRLHRLALANVDLGGLLVDPGSGPAGVLLTQLLAPNSFRIIGAWGQGAGENRLSFEVPQDGSGVLLLAALRWYWDHGHWDSSADDRQWDFPLDVFAAQVALDELLARVADAVEGAVAATLMAGAVDPAGASTALRAVARMVQGTAPPAVDKILDWSLGTTPPLAHTPSADWASPSQVARAALETLTSEWVEAFATARQGDGAPIVVDGARLVPAVEAALADPVASLDACTSLAPTAAVLVEHAEQLRDALADSAQREADGLLEVVARISGLLGGDDFTTAVRDAETAGERAAAISTFRPQSEFRAFRTACERLREVSDSDVALWQSAAKRLTSDGRLDLRYLLDTERWAHAARSVASDLDLVTRCLQETKNEIDRRTGTEIGVGPSEVATEIADKLKAAVAAGRSVLDAWNGVS